MHLGMKGGVRESPLAAAALIFVALTIAAPPRRQFAPKKNCSPP
jgi:hypothetical protein